MGLEFPHEAIRCKLASLAGVEDRGVPYFCSASSRVSMQKESSRVFGYPPDNTFLLAQSMEETRLQKPFAMGMQVIYRDTTRNLLR
ncbi:MAG TPA: hypothetical protein PK125_02055 [Syntrophorhabdus sp.]|nr:hypothetical protein [Syntrophorhabdus sp.]